MAKTTTTTRRKSAAPRSTARKAPAPRASTAAKLTETAPEIAPDIAKTPAAAAPNPAPQVINLGEAGNELRKRELIDKVVERSGVKKKYAKPSVETLLAILGEEIADGRDMNLPPLGKLRINRSEDKGNGRVIICKLRQSTSITGSKEALAEPAE